jgi:hypothetical protein
MTLHTTTLNTLQSTVIDTCKDGHHTDYVIRIQPKHGSASDGEVVYRRFSAFKQLQQLTMRHLHDTPHCCGGAQRCLLSTFVTPVFVSAEFHDQGRLSLFTKNSKSVVEERTVFLNAFLQSLHDALAKCPPLVMQRCENEHCKLTKLLKSFFGCIAVPRSVRARSI